MLCIWESGKLVTPMILIFHYLIRIRGNTTLLKVIVFESVFLIYLNIFTNSYRVHGIALSSTNTTFNHLNFSSIIVWGKKMNRTPLKQKVHKKPPIIHVSIENTIYENISYRAMMDNLSKSLFNILLLCLTVEPPTFTLPLKNDDADYHPILNILTLK